MTLEDYMPDQAAGTVATSESEQPQNEEGAKRDRSTIEFPYYDLEAAVEVAKGVHHLGGTSCEWDQLAAHLKQAPKGGGFWQRVKTANTFGLVTFGGGTVSLTDLGRRLNDEQQEKAAKADAFLKVPLYSKVYEQYKSGTLPPDDALESEIVKMGVAPKQKAKARQAFQRSANLAGYFWSGNNRLVRPAIKGSSAPPTPPVTEPEEPEKKKEKDDRERRHPLIEGLLEELPPPKSEWSTEERKKWLQMASSVFDVIYRDSDDSRGMLKVVLERNSAK
jgi:hypothetical protein